MGLDSVLGRMIHTNQRYLWNIFLWVGLSVNNWDKGRFKPTSALAVPNWTLWLLFFIQGQIPRSSLKYNTKSKPRRATPLQGLQSTWLSEILAYSLTYSTTTVRQGMYTRYEKFPTLPPTTRIHFTSKYVLMSTTITECLLSESLNRFGDS